MCRLFAIPGLDGRQVLSASDSNYKNLNPRGVGVGGGDRKGKNRLTFSNTGHGGIQQGPKWPTSRLCVLCANSPATWEEEEHMRSAACAPSKKGAPSEPAAAQAWVWTGLAWAVEYLSNQ